MIKWITKMTPSGKEIVKDYGSFFCQSGLMIGKQMYKLNLEEMGCYPHQLSMEEELTIGIFHIMIIMIIIAVIVISRRWNEIK